MESYGDIRAITNDTMGLYNTDNEWLCKKRDSFTSKSPGTKPIGCHHGLTIIDVLGYRGISGVQNGGSTRTIYIYISSSYTKCGLFLPTKIAIFGRQDDFSSSKFRFHHQNG